MLLETYVEGSQVVTRAKCMTPHTIGSVAKNSTQLTVQDPTGFATGNTILVAGAGPEGGDLVTTITVAGNVFTLATTASETVRRVLVGKLVNPGTVTFTARNGDATPATYLNGGAEVTNPSVGVWELRLINDEGEWQIHFQGTTPCHCAGETGYRIPHARAKG